MKTNIYINLFSIILTISIFSCSEPIDINVDEVDKKIVLNGFINPDSTVKVNLSKSIGILQKDKEVEFLKNADVKLFENNILIEELQYDTNGYYTGVTFPKIGKTYKITADYPSLTSVDANTLILNPVSVTSVNSSPQFISRVETWYDSNTGQQFDTTIFTLDRMNIELTFTDPAEEENYYLITFTALIPQFGYFPPDYNEVYLGEKMVSLDYNMNNSSWQNYLHMNNFNGYILSDELFNGNSHTLNADIYLYGDSSPETVYINFHRINKEFYQFVISYSKYEETEYNPLAEPVNIKTNINNGFGFFSSYSTAKDSVIIEYADLY
ncbi:MAG: DUF4249 domain-containing protein [Bacteroidales bacterium]|nr:DUF4249 domain-containing protein [Bacteroidales bacterium]